METHIREFLDICTVLVDAKGNSVEKLNNSAKSKTFNSLLQCYNRLLSLQKNCLHPQLFEDIVDVLEYVVVEIRKFVEKENKQLAQLEISLLTEVSEVSKSLFENPMGTLKSLRLLSPRVIYEENKCQMLERRDIEEYTGSDDHESLPLDRSEAILVLQRCFRGFFARRKGALIRELKETAAASCTATMNQASAERLNEAAVTIQKMYRGYRSRKQISRDSRRELHVLHLEATDSADNDPHQERADDTAREALDERRRTLVSFERGVKEKLEVEGFKLGSKLENLLIKSIEDDKKVDEPWSPEESLAFLVDKEFISEIPPKKSSQERLEWIEQKWRQFLDGNHDEMNFIHQERIEERLRLNLALKQMQSALETVQTSIRTAAEASKKKVKSTKKGGSKKKAGSAGARKSKKTPKKSPKKAPNKKTKKTQKRSANKRVTIKDLTEGMEVDAILDKVRESHLARLYTYRSGAIGELSYLVI